jgi:hypothetical protein
LTDIHLFIGDDLQQISPYIPLPILVSVVYAVKVTEQEWDKDPNPHMVPIQSDFHIRDYEFPSNWRRLFKAKIKPTIVDILESNFEYAGILLWKEGHLAFGIFLMMSTLGDDVVEVINYFKHEDTVNKYLIYFGIAKTILEMGSIESGFLRILAYCKYIRETQPMWQTLERAWNLELWDVEENEAAKEEDEEDEEDEEYEKYEEYWGIRMRWLDEEVNG